MKSEELARITESVRREMREMARDQLRSAIHGSRVQVVTYVVWRHSKRAMKDMMVYGKGEYHLTDAKRMLIFHQCNRLFRIQDRIWNATK